MADFVFNIAKGRGVELYNRVENNDPSASALVLIVYTTAGTEAQGQDLDDAAAIEADANFAQAATGAGQWPRKTLTDTELAAFPAPDDTNNRYDVSVPQVTWTAVASSNNVQGLGVFYDADTAGGSDSNLLPVTHHTFTVTTDGNDVVLNSGVFLRAT
jgi:hypothetical protein